MKKHEKKNLLHYAKNAVKICLFDKEAIKAISTDSKATVLAFIIIILEGVTQAIGQKNWWGLIVLPIVFLILFPLSIGIMHGIAKMFKGKADYAELLRASGFGSLIGVLFIFPFNGSLLIFWTVFLMLWSIVIDSIIVSEIYKIRMWKSATAVLVQTAIIILIFALLSSKIGGF